MHIIQTLLKQMVAKCLIKHTKQTYLLVVDNKTYNTKLQP